MAKATTKKRTKATTKKRTKVTPKKRTKTTTKKRNTAIAANKRLNNNKWKNKLPVRAEGIYNIGVKKKGNKVTPLYSGASNNMERRLKEHVRDSKKSDPPSAVAKEIKKQKQKGNKIVVKSTKLKNARCKEGMVQKLTEKKMGHKFKFNKRVGDSC